MQKVSQVVQHTSVLFTVRVRYWLPVELEQRCGLALVNVPVIDSLNSLELESEQMLKGNLRVTVSKGVSGPSDAIDVPELFIHPVHSYSVLIEDVVVVADCLVVFDPSAVGDVKLAVFEQLFD